ncbi:MULTISPECIES: hypothetical protein [unclassified Flavobacterium]|uniref:hypothetical protein n=1 Tax=unclassified Flavobacterium TaxID=196869 RepID=UPI00131AD5EE|nr:MULTISPECIES: hypothetical protein [unclassified Flavobacterium]
MKNSYDELKSEVQEFINKFENDNELTTGLDKYYKGTQILLSGLHNKPKFMFIGINPGAGYYKHNNGEKVKKLEIQKKLEYSYKDFKYALARNTRKLFQLANCTEYLENSVKTNHFFFATTKETELYKLLSHLKHLKVYSRSKTWVDKIVAIVQPEIIICEGKSSFDRFLKNNECQITVNGNVSYAKYGEVHIIGYKRRFSDIIDIEKVAKLINEKLKETTPTK